MKYILVFLLLIHLAIILCHHLLHISCLLFLLLHLYDLGNTSMHVTWQQNSSQSTDINILTIPKYIPNLYLHSVNTTLKRFAAVVL